MSVNVPPLSMANLYLLSASDISLEKIQSYKDPQNYPDAPREGIRRIIEQVTLSFRSTIKLVTLSFRSTIKLVTLSFRSTCI
jgi:hypothetical protein